MVTAFDTVASQVNRATPPQVMTTRRESASKQVNVHSSDGKSGSDDTYSRDRAQGRATHTSNKRHGSKWYYAVAHGQKLGVYTDWGQAKKQVNRFLGAIHKKFWDRKHVEKFICSHQHTISKSESSNSEPSSGDDLPNDVGNGTSHASRQSSRCNEFKTKLGKGPGMPPLEISAPDPSLGKSKELFNMTLADERAMCVKLSPPGLDPKTMKELAEATLDAVQLPGMSPTDTTDMVELVGALKEIMEEKRTDWTEERPHRDVQWRATNKTSLLSIKNQATL